MELRLRKNKRGSILDLIYIMVVLVSVGFLFLIGFKFMDELNTKIQASPDVINDTNARNSISEITNLYPGAMDNAFLFLFIGLCIVAIILAMLVVIHPVFFVFYIILLTIVIFVGGALSNMYQTMAANSQMVDVAARLVWTSHILQWLPFIIGVIGFVLAIVMYKTWQDR